MPFINIKEYTTAGLNVDHTIDYLEFDISGSNQMKTEYAYNGIGAVSAIEYTGIINSVETSMETYDYTYNNRGFIETEDIWSSYTESGTTNTIATDIYKVHTYDELGRLDNTEVTVDGGTPVTTSWTYDDVGNRLSQNEGTTTYDYTYNEFNQLTGIDEDGDTVDDITYLYNARGAQSQEIDNGTTTTYDYDAAGRLSTTTKGTEVTNHFYNGSGQRIRQEADGETYKYYYAGSELLFTTNGGNGKLTENILTPGGQIIVGCLGEQQTRSVCDQPISAL